MSKIKVMFGQLTKQLEAKSVDEGTSISAFCANYGLKYGSSIRVNAKTVNSEYVLEAGDIITSIDNVDGGK